MTQGAALRSRRWRTLESYVAHRKDDLCGRNRVAEEDFAPAHVASDSVEAAVADLDREIRLPPTTPMSVRTVFGLPLWGRTAHDVRMGRDVRADDLFSLAIAFASLTR